MLSANEVDILSAEVQNMYMRMVRQKIQEYVYKTGRSPLTIMMSIPVYEALKAMRGHEITVNYNSMNMYCMGIEVLRVISNDVYIVVGGESDVAQLNMSDIGMMPLPRSLNNTDVGEVVEKAVTPLIKRMRGEVVSTTVSRSHPTDDSILFNVAIHVKEIDNDC